MMTTKATMTSQRKMIWMTSSNRTLHPEIISENLDFILSHFQEPIFPRKIMTKGLAIRKKCLAYKKSLNILELQTMKIAGSTHILHLLIIMALIELAPSFLMIDIDLKGFCNSKDKLDRGYE